MGRRAPGRDMERPLEQISPTKPLGEHASQNKTTRKIECSTSKPPPVLKELSLHHGEGHTWHRSARPLACTDRVRGPEMDLRLQPGALADGAHGVPTGDPGRGRVQQGAGACSRAREDPEGPGRTREGAGGPGRTQEDPGGRGRAREAYLQRVAGLALEGQHVIGQVPVARPDAMAGQGRLLACRQPHRCGKAKGHLGAAPHRRASCREETAFLLSVPQGARTLTLLVTTPKRPQGTSRRRAALS